MLACILHETKGRKLCLRPEMRRRIARCVSILFESMGRKFYLHPNVGREYMFTSILPETKGRKFYLRPEIIEIFVGALGIEPGLYRPSAPEQSPGLFAKCPLSGRRESNSVFTHPKRMYYRYTTPRDERENTMLTCILLEKRGRKLLLTPRQRTFGPKAHDYYTTF